MKPKTKLIYILFYAFAVLIFIITGHIKLRYFGNYLKECIKILKKHKPTEDKDWEIRYKHAK